MHNGDDLLELEEQLKIYVAEAQSREKLDHFNSRKKLKAFKVDLIPAPVPKIEHPEIRPYPCLRYPDGEIITTLFLYNLPGRVRVNDVQKLLLLLNIHPRSIRVAHKTHNQSMAWVDLTPTESLKLQIACRENQVKFRNHKIKARPADRKPTLFIGRAIVPKDYLSTLPRECFEMICPENWRDQLSLISTSKFIAAVINGIRRTLIVSEDDILTFSGSNDDKLSGKKLPLETFLKVVSPCGQKSTFTKVCLTSKVLCQDLSPSIVSHVFNTHHICLVKEIDLSGVVSSPKILTQLENCNALRSFALGNTLGPFEREFQASINERLVILTINDNNFFTTKVLQMGKFKMLENITITRCHKLHSQYLRDFMTTSETLKRVEIEDCRQVIPSPVLSTLLKTLPMTKIREFHLKYTHADELPGDIDYWIPIAWERPAVHLEYLNVHGSVAGIRIISPILGLMPSLKYLNLSELDFNFADLPWFRFEKLNTLIMNGVKHIGESFYRTLFPSLEKLELKAIKCVSGRNIESFIRLNQLQLKSIDLSGAKITDVNRFKQIRQIPRNKRCIANDKPIEIYMKANIINFLIGTRDSWLPSAPLAIYVSHCDRK